MRECGPSSRPSSVHMTRETARRYVGALIAVGSDISAVGTDYYVIVDQCDPSDKHAQRRIEKVTNTFGDMTHLKSEIIAYLHAIGRFT